MSRTLSLGLGAVLVAAATAQTPALRQGVSVRMPVTTSALALPEADRPDSLIVAVTVRGAVYLEVTSMTLAELSAKVKSATEGHPARRVYFKGDARAPYSTVAEVLAALRTAGVNAPMLLTAQDDPADTSYVPPKGLEVSLRPPAAARSVTLEAGSGQTSDAELRRHAQLGKQVVLAVQANALFGDVVHAIDICHAAGAEVSLAMPAK